MPTFPLDRITQSDASVFEIRSKAPGPQGSVPITAAMLLERPSGDLFGWAQNAGMGWNPAKLGGKEILILSTHGGIRRPDGTAVALGYHTGHWEVGLLMEAAAEELSSHNAIPFAAYCTDPCDGRTQGTPGMYDSLPYRNDAAIVFRRQIRSLPTRSGVIGVATCDKGLPAMMMALAGTPDFPCVLIPGGTTLLAEQGEDAGRVQSVGARFAHNEISLEQAAEYLCRSCASPGGGCQFLGTAATSQVVGEALGMSLTHSALAPSGQPMWLDMARRSPRHVEPHGLSGRRKRGVCQRHAERFPHHLRCGRCPQELAPPARTRARPAQIFRRLLQRNLIVREPRAHRLHAPGILPLLRQQRGAARNQNARKIRRASQSHHHGRQALIARGYANHAAARGQRPNLTPEHDGRVVAVRQAVVHAGRALRAAVAGVGAIGGKRDGIMRSQFFSGLFHQQAHFPMPCVIAERDSRAVRAPDSSVGAQDQDFLTPQLCRIPPHPRVLRPAEQIARWPFEQHLCRDGHAALRAGSF